MEMQPCFLVQTFARLYCHQYRNIMTNSCCQYKEMPDGMVIRIFSPQIKNDSQTVKSTANKDHDQYRMRDAYKKSTSTRYHDPAHCQINESGQLIPPPGKKNLEYSS